MACKPICVCLLVTIIAGAIVGGILFAAKSMNKKGVEPSESHKHNYVAALKIAMQFFDIQKSGKLVNNQIKWRGDSGLKDGKEVDLDLSKGMYDAGDAVKFGFPLAFTATMLSWTILERGQRMGMEGVDQLQKAKDSVKWITDYLVNAHPKDNVLYVQVGDAEKDHKCWQRPESITDNKPLFQINTTAPGSDVAAETAAAMASASLVFKKSDPPYSEKLLEHAKKLFIFADKYREYYSVSLPQVKKYYNSTGYGDELLWAASWLYHATQEDIYKDYVVGSEAEEFADWGKPSWFSWDNKLAGVQVLLSRVYFFHGKDNTKLAKYQKSAQALMCTLLPESPSATSDRTNGGLIWIAEWNALQHPVAVAFLASLYGDYMEKSDNEKLECDEKTFKSEDLREFAKKQADYVLGDNPNSMSYLVGYSKKFPKFVHHRGASIPADATTGCKDGYQWLESTKPNPNEATGALVGGPFMNETYIDSRNNSMQGEPTTYNSALLVGLLSSLATSSQSVVTSLG